MHIVKSIAIRVTRGLLVLFAAGATNVGFADAKELKVIELFTSQGCSSCPAADELLAEFITQRDDVLALEFHVDYWNSLVYGDDGSWIDPFSSPAFTERQQIYRGHNLRGRQGLYTPQAIVNGKYVAVGSDKKRLTKELDRVSALPLSVELNEQDSQIAVNIAPAESRPWSDTEKQADVVLVRFLKHTQTDITAGENRHLTVENLHVVTQIAPISTQASGEYRIEAPQNDNEGCAILVQPRELGAILGAALCP